MSVLYDIAKDFFSNLKCNRIKTIKTMIMEKIKSGALKTLIA